MAAYYNEWDAFCCAWQRELISDGLIAPGFVDQTDVRLVRGELLRHFNQWHLFSGIAVWSAALKMAGWADDREVLTVSCPCQPFSSAGKRKGTDDERHLWPYAMQIIREIKPAVIFGEQVWSADTVGAVGKRKPQRADSLSPEAAHRPTWIDDVQAQLEAEGYTFGAVGIPACGLGAPHIRQRLYFCGIRDGRVVDLPALTAWPTPSRLGVTLGDSERKGLEGHARHGDGSPEPGRLGSAQNGHAAAPGGADWMADTVSAGRPEWRAESGLGQVASSGNASRLADTSCEQRNGRGGFGQGRRAEHPVGCTTDGLDDATGPRLNGQECDPEGLARDEARQRERRGDADCDSGTDRRPGPTNGLWGVCDWLLCRDGKWRPAESSALSMADVGTIGRALADSGREGRSFHHPLAEAKDYKNRIDELRGSGNALCIAQAAEFIAAVMEEINA